MLESMDIKYFISLAVRNRYKKGEKFEDLYKAKYPDISKSDASEQKTCVEKVAGSKSPSFLSRVGPNTTQ